MGRLGEREVEVWADVSMGEDGYHDYKLTSRVLVIVVHLLAGRRDGVALNGVGLVLRGLADVIWIHLLLVSERGFIEGETGHAM